MYKRYSRDYNESLRDIILKGNIRPLQRTSIYIAECRLATDLMFMEITMVESSDEFFEGKRPWSKIKDEVLGNYMTPYLAKVNTRGQPILLIDGYAGPGIYEDSECGSPLMRYLEPEYNATVQRLVEQKKLSYFNPRGTNRLNEDCKLYLPKQ